MNQEIEDPVVAEMRAVRRELSERFGDDVNALCEFLARLEQQHEKRLVSRVRKAPRVVSTSGVRRK